MCTKRRGCHHFEKYHATKVLFLNVAFSDLLYSLSLVFDVPGSAILCWIDGAVFNQLGSISSVLWVAMSAKSWYDVVVNDVIVSEINMTKMTLRVWLTSVVCFTLPAFNLEFGIFTVYEMSYGDSQSHCWMRNDRWIDSIWRYLLFYVPLWIVIGYLIFVYIEIWGHFKIIPSAPKLCTSKLSAFGLFPLVMIICYIPASVRRTWDTLHWMGLINQTPYSLMLAQAISTGQIGFIDSIVMFVILTKCKCNREIQDESSAEIADQTTSPNEALPLNIIDEDKVEPTNVSSGSNITSTERYPQLKSDQQDVDSIHLRC